MTINQLQYALAAAKQGSFSKAARQLNVSQPALSTQIQKLEDEIGIKLFDRATSPMEPTAVGEKFLHRAENLVADSQDLLNFGKTVDNAFKGTLKIGAIPTLSPFLIPLFSQSITQDHPDLSLDISEMLTRQILEKVRSGALDMGIISTPVDVYGIETIPLFYERFFLFSSDQSQKTIATASEIDSNELWVLEEGNCFRDQINDFCNLSKNRNQQLKYRCNSIDSLMRVVEHQGGLTILPELSTISLSEEQETHVTPIDGKAREIGLVTRKQSAKSRYVDLVCEYILDNIPSNLKSREGLEIVDPGISD